MVTKRVAIPSSRQPKDYLLCNECEQLFCRNGEDYAMRQVHNGKNFPLLETIRRSLPIERGADSETYALAAIPSLDTAALAYYAVSVFWRASVHVWRLGDSNTISIDLGPYEELIRQYLLGQCAFPDTVALGMFVGTDSSSQNSLSPPTAGDRRMFGCIIYHFNARGLSFLLFVGKQMPEYFRLGCFVKSEYKLVVATSLEYKLQEALSRLFKTHTKPFQLPRRF